MNMEDMSESLLRLDKQCVKRLIGPPLAVKSPDFIGPESAALHTLVEYFTLYILDLVAKSDRRFEVSELHRCGNFYAGCHVDVPDEVSYFVVIKKFSPEACFFEDVGLGNTGGCKIRVGDAVTKQEYSDCLSSEGFLLSDNLVSRFASLVQRFAVLPRQDLYPSDITNLLPIKNVPQITQCNSSKQGVQLTITTPLIRKLSWKTDSLRICLIPSIRFPGWPSSADFPSRVEASHPLYSSFTEAASNGFYVSPAGLSVAPSNGLYGDSVWQVSTATMATGLINQSPQPLAGNTLFRLLSVLLGHYSSDHILEESLITVPIKSAIPKEMIATVILWEIEEKSASVDWTPAQTSERVMSALSRLKHAFHGTPLRDYFFPGRKFPEISDNVHREEALRVLDQVEASLVDRVYVDLGQSSEVRKREQTVESMRLNDKILRFIESPSVSKFPQDTDEAWQLLADTDVLSHKIYESGWRMGVLEFAQRFTENNIAYKLVVICEFFRQQLAGDPAPVQSILRALQHTREATSSNSTMSLLHDMDPFLEDALWLATYGSVLQSSFLPRVTIEHQPVAGAPVTQPDGWGQGENGGGGGTFDGPAVEEDSGCCHDCCDGDCDCCNCCGDCDSCDCGDCNCDCDCDCVIM
ncbi:uncharacterized protein [Ptychodera flava]|uniref:uncharacterized protein n=1 Tax=Ptychodera flava TaxID=63121 RepID=UPI003969CC92